MIKANVLGKVIVMFMAIATVSSAFARRTIGKSGNTNCTDSCMGSVNVNAGWTKCRAVAGNGTFWINPSTGICEHWNTPYCNLTIGSKISNAPRTACPK